MQELSAIMSVESFWKDDSQANRVIRELKGLKVITNPWERINKDFQELKELAGVVKEDDLDLCKQMEQGIDQLINELAELEFKTLLSGEFDKNNAILSINAGAGGTESCDWADMLLRMYTRWGQTKNYKIKTIDILPGQEAGIKNVTILIEGDYVYGYLKSERGVHRLVRISPFDANKRRHTSFASVDVIPELQDDIDVKIEEKDLRIDVYRSSGPGGQGVNTTDSAVRITHLPSGIIVQCQNERSQYQNKQTALKILKAKLYERIEEQSQEKLNQHHKEKRKIEWGSQIRSYVMHPYNLVKDHRTDYETGNVNAVMDGQIDGFIQAYLKQVATDN